MTTPCPVSRTEAALQLERILGSPVFHRAQRSQGFLRYLVDSALAHPPIGVKEYTIAVDVFGRPATYDPAVDATVRVEAGRLRSRLREYYDEEGRTDPVLIHIPKGAYAAVLSVRAADATAQAPTLQAHAPSPPRSTAVPRTHRGPPALRAPLFLARLVGFGLLVIGGIAGGRRLVLALSRRNGHQFLKFRKPMQGITD